MGEVTGNPSRYVVTATMDDVPHLSKEAQDAILAGMPEHQREARRTGVPSLGSGAIFPYPEELLRVSDFPIPSHWARGYGMDTGWRATAAVFVAHNRETDVMYIYDCYKQGFESPATHAAAIKARGEWIPGIADAADIDRTDGEQYIKKYIDLGLRLTLPDKRSVEANILAAQERMTSGRLRVFASCSAWWDEYRIYRRDENGQIVRSNDHLMACTQYRVKAPVLTLKTLQEAVPQQKAVDYRNLPDMREQGHGQGAGGWMR